MPPFWLPSLQGFYATTLVKRTSSRSGSIVTGSDVTGDTDATTSIVSSVPQPPPLTQQAGAAMLAAAIASGHLPKPDIASALLACYLTNAANARRSTPSPYFQSSSVTVDESNTPSPHMPVLSSAVMVPAIQRTASVSVDQPGEAAATNDGRASLSHTSDAVPAPVSSEPVKMTGAAMIPLRASHAPTPGRRMSMATLPSASAGLLSVPIPDNVAMMRKQCQEQIQLHKKRVAAASIAAVKDTNTPSPPVNKKGRSGSEVDLECTPESESEGFKTSSPLVPVDAASQAQELRQRQLAAHLHSMKLLQLQQMKAAQHHQASIGRQRAWQSVIVPSTSSAVSSIVSGGSTGQGLPSAVKVEAISSQSTEFTLSARSAVTGSQADSTATHSECL